MVAIIHDSAFPDDLSAVSIRDDDGCRLLQLLDSHGVAMIEMLMRDKDIVSLGQLAVIGHRFQLPHGIYFHLPAIKGDAETTVLDGRKDNLLSALRLERVGLSDITLLSYRTTLF